MLYLFFVFIDMHRVFFLHHAFIIFLTFIETDSVILQNIFNPFPYLSLFLILQTVFVCLFFLLHNTVIRAAGTGKRIFCGKYDF